MTTYQLIRGGSLCSLATHFQTRFLESIPRLIAGLKKFSTLSNLAAGETGTFFEILTNTELTRRTITDFTEKNV